MILIGAIAGVALIILRWALSAVVPESNLQTMDRAISQGAKLIVLTFVVGFVLFALYLTYIYKPN